MSHAACLLPPKLPSPLLPNCNIRLLNCDTFVIALQHPVDKIGPNQLLLFFLYKNLLAGILLCSDLFGLGATQ